MSPNDFIKIIAVFAYLADVNLSVAGQILEDDGDKFPSVVSISVKGGRSLSCHFCTGVLISHKHVLTAAHCIKDLKKSHVEILAGSSNLQSVDVKRFGVESWLTYEDWALKNDKIFDKLANDVAVIKLDVTDTNIPHVSILYVKAKKLDEAPVVLAGWGVMNKQNNDPTMKVLSQFVLPKSECIKRIENNYPHLKKFFGHDGLICTYTKSAGFVSSSGFSGGPIFYENKMLAAIHIGKCPKRDPSEVSVEAYMNYYKDFIQYAIHD